MDSRVLGWNQQAMDALKQGRLDQSLELLEKAKETGNAVDPTLVALTQSNLSSYYAVKGESAAALSCLRKALHFDQKAGNTVSAAATCLRIASTYQSLGQFSKGLSYSRRTAEVLQGRLAERSPVVAKTLALAHYESAKLCELMTDYHGAGTYYLKGLQVAQQRLKPTHPIATALKTGFAQLEETAHSYKFKFSRGLAPLRLKKTRQSRTLSRPQTKPLTAGRRTRPKNDAFLRQLKSNVLHVTAR